MSSLLPLYLMPLQIDTEGVVRDFSSSIIALAFDKLDSFISVGKGIGSIMLLFVAIYYIIAILDGGKFQIKMLFPLLIFLLVCNFNWVAVPVTSFTKTITSTCMTAVGQSRSELFASYGCTDGASMIDLFWAIKDGKRTDPDKQAGKKVGTGLTGGQSGSDGSGSGDGSTEDDDDPGSPFLHPIDNLVANIKTAVKESTTDMGNDIVNDVRTSDSPINGKTDGLKITFIACIASIMSFICSLVAIACQAMGIILTCIVVVFGPITWAFAVFPGRIGNLMSWFIRICQFSLYAPVCSLIDLFSLEILSKVITSDGSFLGLFAVMAADLICITAIPTIASMIIEGAQGAVSLSQGLQTVAHAASLILTPVKMLGKLAGGKKGGGGSGGSGNGGGNSGGSGGSGNNGSQGPQGQAGTSSAGKLI